MPGYVPRTPGTGPDKIAFDERAFGQVNRLLHIARDQHDRVLALSMASFAEECLGRLLRVFLRDVKATEELLEGFNAPLGNFAARTKLCHAMGLITDLQFKDLELVRKIRNEFAHTWDDRSFDDAKIGAWVDAINPPQLSNASSKSPENKFREAMTGLLIELEVMHDRVSSNNLALKVIGVQLSLRKPDSDAER